MKCDKCGSDQLITTNTRGTDWGVKRTRVCLVCGYHMATIEISKITEEAITSLKKFKKLTQKRQRKETE